MDYTTLGESIKLKPRPLWQRFSLLPLATLVEPTGLESEEKWKVFLNVYIHVYLK